MQLIVKIFISISIIVLCTLIGKKYPSLAGLIATMPLTGLLVFVWLYFENKGDFGVLNGYTQGALWGIIPSILFFLCAYVCIKKQLPFAITMALSATAWFAGACVHQWILR